MPLYKNPQPIRFTPQHPVEMHFHDSDETWIMMGGKAMAHMVDRQGDRRDFEIEAGDIWMVEAGVEHGCDPITEEVLIFPFMGTIPEGSHPPGHYYFEKEQYMPTLVVRKDQYYGRTLKRD
jgi:hypothetical protein